MKNIKRAYNKTSCKNLKMYSISTKLCSTFVYNLFRWWGWQEREYFKEYKIFGKPCVHMVIFVLVFSAGEGVCGRQCMSQFDCVRTV